MAVGDTHVFPDFLTPLITQLSFQSHQLFFLHALAEVRGENIPEKNFASSGYQTHNNQVMSPKHPPLSHPGRAEAGGRANGGVRHGSIDTACTTENYTL